VCVNVCVLVCAASQLMSKASHVWLMRALYCTLGEEGCTCVCVNVWFCVCVCECVYVGVCCVSAYEQGQPCVAHAGAVLRPGRKGCVCE